MSKRGWYGGRGPRPDGSVRRSQMLTSAGPGALVDLVDHAVMIGGLDDWRYPNEQAGFISEPRLEAQALKLLRNLDWWDHKQVRLRLAPECDDDQASQNIGVQVPRFPGWYLCQAGQCRSLIHWKELDKSGRHRCTHSDRKGFPVVAIRFVSACTHGHIQDIYWPAFVHRGEPDDSLGEDIKQGWKWCRLSTTQSQKVNDPLGADYTSRLYFGQTGTSGDLSDYVVGCRQCGKSRGLQDLLLPEALGKCQGHRPWLGGWDVREKDCKEKARLLTRTASNAYFPQTITVLSIPDPAEELRKAVGEVWSIVQKADESSIDTLLTVVPVERAVGEYPKGDVLAEIKRRQLGLAVPPKNTRETEWEALYAAPEEKPGDYPDPEEERFARRANLESLPDFIDRVVLVHHLRVVSAQVGFTRIDGVNRDAENEFKTDVRTAPISLNADWLPAVEYRGEGVFIGFDIEAVKEWEARQAVKDRETLFQQSFFKANDRRSNKRRLLEFTGIRHVMLHSLSHMLINAISLSCGYPASSIKERIYCSTEGTTPRAGILLYTGSPSSEGTLGGLVEVGRDILTHLKKAAEMGRLCSNDPVCAQHEPRGDHARRHHSGAACHGCLLIGEPSCERGNRDLDRTLVVPTVDHDQRDAAFLRDWVDETLQVGLASLPSPGADDTAGIDDDSQDAFGGSGSSHGAGVDSQALQQVLDDCLDDESKSLVRTVHSLSLPLPEVGSEVLGGVPSELLWPDLLVVLLASEPSEWDRKALEDSGYQVGTVQVAPAELVSWLHSAQQEQSDG